VTLYRYFWVTAFWGIEDTRYRMDFSYKAGCSDACTTNADQGTVHKRFEGKSILGEASMNLSLMVNLTNAGKEIPGTEKITCHLYTFDAEQTTDSRGPMPWETAVAANPAGGVAKAGGAEE
jgi:hypothetical protein